MVNLRCLTLLGMSDIGSGVYAQDETTTAVDEKPLVDHMLADGLNAKLTDNGIQITLKSKTEVFFPKQITHLSDPFYGIQPIEEGGIVGVSVDGYIIRSTFTRDQCDASSIVMKFADECYLTHMPLNPMEDRSIEPSYVEAPRCLYDSLIKDMDVCVDSVTVGYALDGFKMKMANYDVSDSLDECGGMWDDNREYAYYFTDTWPYSIRCFRGSVNTALAEFINLDNIGETSCPKIYEYIEWTQGYMRALNNDQLFNEYLNEQNRDNSPAAVGKPEFGRSHHEESKPKRPTTLDPLNNLVNSVFDGIGDTMESIFSSLPNRRRRQVDDDKQRHKDKHHYKDSQKFPVIPFGYFGTTKFEYCTVGNCTVLCSERRSAGCEEQAGSEKQCLGLFGAYRQAVVCERKMEYDNKIVMPFGAWNKNNEYKLTSDHKRRSHTADASSVFATDSTSDAWDCYCRNFAGFQSGERAQITNEAVVAANMTNNGGKIKTALHCGACPSNLLPVDISSGPIREYATCASQTPVHFIDEVKISHLIDHKMENHCTCPPGTVWSWLKMWCVPMEACQPEEIGVPVKCETKAEMFAAIGYPKLECDKYTGEYPDQHCVYDKEKKFCWSIDNFGDRLPGTEKWEDIEVKTEDSNDVFYLKEDQWLTEWYNRSSPYGYDNTSYESEYMDQWFFSEMSCKPVKMIVADLDGIAYDKSICLGEGYIGADLQSGNDYNAYASYYCSSQNGVPCPDVKLRFVCEFEESTDDKEVDYNDYYDYDDYNYYDNWSSESETSTVWSYQTTAATYDIYGSGYGNTTMSPTTAMEKVYVDAYDLAQFIMGFDLMLLHGDNELVACRALFIQDLAKNPTESCGACFKHIFVPCMSRHQKWMEDAGMPFSLDELFDAEEQYFCNNRNLFEEWGITADEYMDSNKNYVENMVNQYFDKRWVNDDPSIYYDLGQAIFKEQANFTCIYTTDCWESVAAVTSNMMENSVDMCTAWEKMNQCRRANGVDHMETWWSDIQPSLMKFEQPSKYLDSVQEYVDDMFYYKMQDPVSSISVYIYMMDLNPLCGTDEVWPKKPCFGTQCRIPEVLDIAYDCMNKYMFENVPLGDEALDSFMHVGACVAAKFTRSCMYGDKFSDTSEEEAWIYRTINEEVDYQIKSKIQSMLQSPPRSLEDIYEIVIATLGEFQMDVEPTIKMVESFMGRTIMEAVNEILTWEEEILFINSDPTLRPIRDSMDICLNHFYTMIKGDNKLDVCISGGKMADFIVTWQTNVEWNIPNMFKIAELFIEFAEDFISGTELENLLENGAMGDIEDIKNEIVENMKLPSAGIYLIRIFHTSLVQYQKRKMDECLDQHCNAFYNQWSEWSSCTQSCETGRNYRRRSCVDRQNNTVDWEECYKLSQQVGAEERECNTFPCAQKCEIASDGNDSITIDCSNRGHHMLPFETSNGSKNMLVNINSKLIAMKKVASWNLTGNSIGDDCWPAIVEIVNKSPRLKEINLDANNFTFIPKDMLEALKKGAHLSIRSNNIHDIDFPENDDTSKFNGKMMLDIRQNPIRKIPIEFLSIMKNFKSITSNYGSYESDKKKYNTTT